MRSQLVLLEEVTTNWRLDDRTREVGRQGVLAAREALVAAIRRSGGVRPCVATDEQQQAA